METETLAITQRKCRDCGKPLGAGREDRQYCDSACKTNYNNRRRREQAQTTTGDQSLNMPEHVIRIQEILLNNRSILETLCTEEKAGTLHWRHLMGKGFNLKYFTSEAQPTGNGHVYRFCFEYGYFIGDEDYVVVVCRMGEVS